MASREQNDAKLTTIKNLSERMARADWWHDYSDDYEVRQRGLDQIDGIYKDLAKLRTTDPEAVHALWHKHAPKEWSFPDELKTPEESRAEKAAVDRVLAALPTANQLADPTPSTWDRAKAALRELAAKLAPEPKESRSEQTPNKQRDNQMER